MTKLRKAVNYHRSYWKNEAFARSVFFGAILLFASLFLNYAAGTYATNSESNFVTDIVLSNIPVFDVDGIFVYGSIIFWIFVGFLGLLEPKRIPFLIKSVALFVFVRSIFISLTHIGPFPSHLIVDSNILAKFTFDGDLFFSGHVGLAFLMTLAFWENTYLRFIFLASSAIFSAVVLLGHLHYSIDVASAFFITYTIHHMAMRFFHRDWKIFLVGLEHEIL